MQHIIIGNFGNHSIAALQYLLEQSIAPIHFLYADTGWASPKWHERVNTGKAFAEQHGVHFVTLHPPKNFQELVLDRQQFPSPKFQWCVSFLKALPIIDYLDEVDPACEATIVSGKRRSDSRRYQLLKAFEEDDRYFDGRKLWNPLVETNDSDFKALIEKAGFPFLPYPAKACSPCIHSSADDISQLSTDCRLRLAELEAKISGQLFEKRIQEFPEKNSDPHPQHHNLSQFDMGCGSPWGCGE